MTQLKPPRLSGQEFKADPYPAYAALRDEDPAFCRTSADGVARLWFITRYEDVAAALRDQRRFVKDVRNTLTEEERAALPPAPELYDLLTHHMLNADGAQHARLRALVGKAFAARRVDQLEPRIAALAAALLDRLQPRGHMDLIEEFSLPFSIAVIAELLGIPSRDRQRFRAWSHVLVAPSADSARNERKTAKLRPAMADFVAYLGALCEERRRAPQNDLISTLLQAEDDGAHLTPEELYSMVLLLTVVGHETSVYLIGNCVLTLLLHPPALAQVRQAPELLPQAIEELIRYDGPVERATMRFAAEDIHLHGQVIHRGDAVSLALAAAHRDPSAYAAPDTLDIGRPDCRHLGFGLGVHYCLGAPLARLETRVALAALLQRLSDLRLSVPPGELRWVTNPILRAPRRLPVQWTPHTEDGQPRGG